MLLAPRLGQLVESAVRHRAAHAARARVRLRRAACSTRWTARAPRSIDPANATGVLPVARAATVRNLDQTVDLMGVFNYPPLGGWPASTLGGETFPYEGYWYFHLLPFTTKAYVPQNTSTIAFGIDVTKPRAVTGLVASPSLDESHAGEWTTASRVHSDVGRRTATTTCPAWRTTRCSSTACRSIPDGTRRHPGRIYEVIGRTPAS